MRSYWSKVGASSNMAGGLIRRQLCEDRDTQGDVMWQWRQRLELYTYKPRNDKNCQHTTSSQEESRKDSEEAWPWRYLDFGLWPPALGDSNFVVLGHTVCGALLGSHKKLIQLVVRPVIGGPLPSLNPLLHPVFSQPLKFLRSHLRNSLISSLQSLPLNT